MLEHCCGLHLLWAALRGDRPGAGVCERRRSGYRALTSRLTKEVHEASNLLVVRAKRLRA
jgi:hypothetical protein